MTSLARSSPCRESNRVAALRGTDSRKGFTYQNRAPRAKQTAAYPKLQGYCTPAIYAYSVEPVCISIGCAHKEGFGSVATFVMRANRQCIAGRVVNFFVKRKPWLAGQCS